MMAGVETPEITRFRLGGPDSDSTNRDRVGALIARKYYKAYEKRRTNCFFVSKQGIAIPCHREIGLNSPKLRVLLRTKLYPEGEQPKFHFPDIETSILRDVVHFMYTGVIVLTSKRQLEAIKDILFNVFGLGRYLETVINPTEDEPPEIVNLENAELAASESSRTSESNSLSAVLSQISELPTSEPQPSTSNEAPPIEENTQQQTREDSSDYQLSSSVEMINSSDGMDSMSDGDMLLKDHHNIPSNSSSSTPCVKKVTKRKKKNPKTPIGEPNQDSDSDVENSVPPSAKKAKKSNINNNSIKNTGKDDSDKRKCYECGKKITPSQMKRHTIKHNYDWFGSDLFDKTVDGKYKCRLCDRIGKSDKILVIHHAIAHKQFEMILVDKNKTIEDFYEPILELDDVIPSSNREEEENQQIQEQDDDPDPEAVTDVEEEK